MACRSRLLIGNGIIQLSSRPKRSSWKEGEDKISGDFTAGSVVEVIFSTGKSTGSS